MHTTSYPAKIWDFILGSLVTGTFPVIVFWFCWILAPILALFVPFVTMFFICRWRRQHRLLPVGFILFEVLSGLAIGVLFSVIMCRGFANLPP
jgi:hypothetical protein